MIKNPVYYFAFVFLMIFSQLKIMSQNVELKIQMGHLSGIKSLEFSNDDNYILSFDKSKTMIVWDISLGVELLRLKDDYDILFCKFSSDQKYVISVNIKNRIKLWSIKESKLISENNFGTRIWDITVISDSEALIIGDKLYRYNYLTHKKSVLYSGEFIRIIPVRDYYILFNESGEIFMINNELKVNRMPYSLKIKRHSGDEADYREKYAKRVTQRLEEIDNRFYKKFYIKNIMTPSIGKPVDLHLLSFAEDKYIFYGSKNKISAFDLKKKKKTYKLYTYFLDVEYSSMAVSSKNNLLVLGTNSDRILVYKLGKKNPEFVSDKHLNTVTAIEFSHSDKYFATASDDRSVIVWSAETLIPLKRLFSRGFTISGFDLDTVSGKLFMGDDVGFVKTLDYRNITNSIDSKKIHNGEVTGLKYIPRYKRTISIGADNYIVISNDTNNMILKSKFCGFLRNAAFSKQKIEPFYYKNRIFKIPSYVFTDTSTNEFIVAGEGITTGKIIIKTYSLDDNKFKSKYIKKNSGIGDMFYSSANHQIYLLSRGEIIDKVKTDKSTPVLIPEQDFGVIAPVYSATAFIVNDNGNIVYNNDSVISEYDVNTGSIYSRNLKYHIYKIRLTKDSDVVVISGNKIFFLNDDFSIDTAKTIISLNGNISDISFIDNDKILGISGGIINIWNKNKDVVSYAIVDNNKIVAFTTDGYYMTNRGGINGLSFKLGSKVLPPEQFDLKFNRPDIITGLLGYADSSLIAAYHRAYLKRLKKMGFTEDMLKDDFHLPDIKINNFEEIPVITDSSSVSLNLEVNDSKYKLDRINVWVNDVAVYGTNGISLRNKNTKFYKTKIRVNLPKGKNKVQVSVLNQAGAESYKQTFEIECTYGKTKPDLYLITIGESKFKDAGYNLTYAAKDALDVASLFSKNKIYGDVFIKTLLNEQVTKENIAALRTFLNKAGINDEVMIFIAGHGVLDENLDYFFAGYDMDFNNPAKRGIAYDDLEGLLDGIKPLKKILMIDACHSGEIDKEEVDILATTELKEGDIQFRAVGNSVKPKLGMQNTSELTKALFTDLRRGTGATVVSSAGGGEYAMESGEWKNGLFTYCLINGIQTKEADLNKDGKIMLSELQKYVQQKVVELSNGQQQPTSRIENITMDFRVW